MPSVTIRETDSFDVALRRFKRACEKAGFPTKLRQIEFYEKKTWKRRRKKAAAVKRYQKKLTKSKEAVMRVRERRMKAFVSELREQTREETNEQQQQ